jgi:hypothetical protein
MRQLFRQETLRYDVPPFASDSLSLGLCFLLGRVTSGVIGSDLYGYYGFVCRPQVHNSRIAAGLRA